MPSYRNNITEWICPNCGIILPMKGDPKPYFPIRCLPSCGVIEKFDEWIERLMTPRHLWKWKPKPLGLGDLVALAIKPWIPVIEARPRLVALLVRWGVIDDELSKCEKCKIRQAAMNNWCRCRWWCRWGIKPVATGVQLQRRYRMRYRRYLMRYRTWRRGPMVRVVPTIQKVQG